MVNGGYKADYSGPADGKPLPTLAERKAAQVEREKDIDALGAALKSQTMTPNSRGGVHTCEWLDSGLKVTVSKLREQSNGDLRADFEVKGRPPGAAAPFTYFSRFNLKSGQTKASTARDIISVAPAGWIADWRYIVERSCNEVRESFNKGDDGIDLCDSTASPNTEYRLFPYLQERQAAILYGPGDSGKSFFGVLAGYLITTGRSDLGMTPKQGNVLFLDYETDEAVTRRRLSMIAAGYGQPIPPFFHYMHMRRPLEDDFDRVSAYLMKHNINFVIIDSAARAVLEPESSAPVNQYFNALSGLECTTLTIAHVSKTGKESEPFGSSFWHNGARATYRAMGKQSGSMLTMGLRNYKNNNGKRLDDRALEFTFSQDTVTVTGGDLDAIPGSDDNAPMHRRILNYLQNNGGPVTANDLAVTLNAGAPYVRTVLGRELKDKVVRLDDGRWGVRINDAK